MAAVFYSIFVIDSAVLFKCQLKNNKQIQKWPVFSCQVLCKIAILGLIYCFYSIVTLYIYLSLQRAQLHVPKIGCYQHAGLHIRPKTYSTYHTGTAEPGQLVKSE